VKFIEEIYTDKIYSNISYAINREVNARSSMVITYTDLSSVNLGYPIGFILGLH
jgi:hypothetical protein